MARFEEYFLSLRHRRIAVLGLGVSNRPLVRLLLEFGCNVVGCDRTPREKLDAEVLELERLGCRLSVGEGYLDDLEADIVFRTPGMHPGNPAIVALKDKGAEITSEMEVFFELCPCPILAVTGSDGKTTTTSIIARILETAGKTVWLGGNIGTPLLPRCREIMADHIAVVELSSFQLMDMRRSPHIAVVTNLAPNHLDVHKDMDEYVQAKKNIFRYQSACDRLILNADNAITDGFEGTAVTEKFSRSGKDCACRVENGTIYVHGHPVLDCSDILLPGVHNIENYMAAILAVEGLADVESIRKTARTFGGVKHRIELVRVVNGVRYYNDSIASSPSRTISGLSSFEEKVILLAGGYDKHVPFDELGPVICRKVKKLLLSGATAAAIRAAVEGCDGEKPEIYQFDLLDEAITAATKVAESGDVVLLSPASASFDQFKNFEIRGDYFRQRVMEL